jgi:hypothetical protein
LRVVEGSSYVVFEENQLPGAGLAASTSAAVFSLACHARNARGDSLTALAIASIGALAFDNSAIVQSWVIVGLKGFFIDALYHRDA